MIVFVLCQRQPVAVRPSPETDVDGLAVAASGGAVPSLPLVRPAEEVSCLQLPHLLIIVLEVVREEFAGIAVELPVVEHEPLMIPVGERPGEAPPLLHRVVRVTGARVVVHGRAIASLRRVVVAALVVRQTDLVVDERLVVVGRRPGKQQPVPLDGEVPLRKTAVRVTERLNRRVVE